MKGEGSYVALNVNVQALVAINYASLRVEENQMGRRIPPKRNKNNYEARSAP